MWLLRTLLPLAPFARRMRHGMTLGVRAIAIGADRRVLLVRHTYSPGWHLPGGGVDVGETAVDAARRELLEETNTRAIGPLELHGVFFNAPVGGRDHVVCFRVPRFETGPLPGPTFEIAEVGAFPLDALPETATPATRRRLQEVASGAAPDDCW